MYRCNVASYPAPGQPGKGGRPQSWGSSFRPFSTARLMLLVRVLISNKPLASGSEAEIDRGAPAGDGPGSRTPYFGRWVMVFRHLVCLNSQW